MTLRLLCDLHPHAFGSHQGACIQDTDTEMHNVNETA